MRMEEFMRLLLAEDEKALSEALTTVLNRHGYSVNAVYDGLSALRQLESEIYDGAILDIMMPGADGLTVLKALREKGNKMPVMILTARSEIESKMAGFDSGADDYLPKPFDVRELLARIRVMMKVQSVPADEISNVGNIRLNYATLEISSESSSFRLSGKEFQMMRLLMENPGIPISAETFLEKVWGTFGEEERQAVWAYVAFLRKKLKALHADIQISEAGKESYELEVIEQ